MALGRVAHITLGKAGSQWIKDVLTDPDIFNRQKGLRFFQPRGGSYRISDFAREPDGTVAAPIFHVTFDDWKQYGSKGDRCIAVLRDPRDSIVSWAFSVAYSHVTEDHIQILRPALLSLDLRGKLEVSMYTFWESSAAQRSWAKAPDTESERIFRYEAIVADQYAAFRSMVDFLGWDAPDDVLRTVIDRLSFKTRSGREPGTKDEHSHYRNGRANDWKNYFDRSLAERFETACPGLLVDLGYESASTWWREVPERCTALDADAESNAAGANERAELVASLDAARKEVELLRDARSADAALRNKLRLLAEGLTAKEPARSK